MDVRTVLLVDVGSEVSGALVHDLLDVWTDVLVVTGDVGALGVVSESIDVFGAVVVLALVVSASFVTVLHATLVAVLVDIFVRVAHWNIHALS